MIATNLYNDLFVCNKDNEPQMVITQFRDPRDWERMDVVYKAMHNLPDNSEDDDSQVIDTKLKKRRSLATYVG